MSERRRVSVVIPVYNGATYLEAAIQSVLRQTRPADEILVFDNASTDESVAIASRLLGPDRVRTTDVNQGANVNFARAASEASGDLLLWLAADDELLPQHLERCCAVFDANPSAQACLPGIRFVDPDGEVTREWTDEPLASPDPATRLRSFLRRDRWTEFYCLYPREVALSAPLGREQFASDVVFTWSLLMRGPLAVIAEPLLVYREFPARPVEDSALLQNPLAHRTHWRKLRLWRDLWNLTKNSDVRPEVASLARRELLSVWLDRSWQLHLREDLMLRWPRTGARIKGVVRSRRKLLGVGAAFPPRQ